jgi:hypothetical protein
MPEWLDFAMGIGIAAAAVLLVIKYRGHRWLTKWRSHV